MTVELVPIFDATHANIATMPAGQHAGYVTGTPQIEWTAKDWQRHPYAVRIDQSPTASAWDALADVQDYENGAVQLAELPGRVRAMHAAYHAGARPGQRLGAVYVGARPNSTHVVNALEAAGITGGVPLAIAAPGITPAAAGEIIQETDGTPWPIVWVQFDWRTTYDAGVAARPWLERGSVAPGAPVKLAEVTVKLSDGTSRMWAA